ncbi:YchF/TatD family DNA exonuclease [Geoglobus acetivorans]|uniref:TatD family hydrolase n=1 Tax=Geoglobus acetivorans TaxID=565033 RepID=A0ABZ3H131_GEOAI|nr:TatD family hydrolase [Geoglobus acetivorans]
MELADIHCHLNFGNFKKDRNEVIRRAKIAGLSFIIDSGFDYGSNEKSLIISGQYDGYVFSTLGFSPNRIGKSDYRYVSGQISENLDSIVGIGEIGIDLKKAQAEYETQKEIFLHFLQLAEEFEKPAVIHARKAEEKVFELLKGRDVVAVFHCYTGSEKLAERIVDAGMYISLSTLLCYSENVQKIAEVVEPENVMFETDSPFLSPLKGRNEPANVQLAYQKFAEIKNMSVDEVAIKLIKNARNVFNID